MNVVETMPTELQLVSPPTMPQARSYRSGFLSDLQEYDVVRGNLIKINIPRLQRSYLEKDSYLQFRLTVDVTTGALNNMLTLDRAGAYSLFDRMEVYDYLGGTLLEQTNQLAPLITVLNDVHKAYTDLNSAPAAIEGFDSAGVSITSIVPDASDYLELKSTPSGATIGQELNASQTACWSIDLSLRLPSFLGLFSEKLCPLHNGFTVNLYLNSMEQATVARNYDFDSGLDSTVATGFVIKQAWLSDVQLNCRILELGDQAESLLMSTQPWVVHSKQYRNFRDNIDAKTSYKRLDMNLNVVSLRNIYAIQRPWSYQNNLSFPGIGERVRNVLQRYDFQYGSSYLPEVGGVLTRGVKSVFSKNNYLVSYFNTAANTSTTATVATDSYKSRTFSPAYFELMRTSTNGLPSINFNEYTKDVIGTAPPFGNSNRTYSGKFVACLNTQLTPKSIISGLDTNGLMVGLNLYFDQDRLTARTEAGLTGMTTQIDTILDVWAEHDTFIQVIPGVATTVTF